MQKVERSRQNKPGAFSVGDLQKEMWMILNWVSAVAIDDDLEELISTTIVVPFLAIGAVREGRREGRRKK